MPPPSPPPLAQSTKQPAVARTKGKPAGTGSSRKKATATTRSRSLSVKPPESTPAPMEVKEEIQQDDRLYCLCKTPYEEDKIMIACDRCDEWYHPGCVGMPEVEVDLVDQFICSLCSARECCFQLPLYSFVRFIFSFVHSSLCYHIVALPLHLLQDITFFVAYIHKLTGHV